MIAASAQKPVDPVVAEVEVPNNQWTLLVAPVQGWVPSWRNPMLATVIIISVLMGGLVLATLVSRHLQLWLLKETKVCEQGRTTLHMHVASRSMRYEGALCRLVQCRRLWGVERLCFGIMKMARLFHSHSRNPQLPIVLCAAWQAYELGSREADVLGQHLHYRVWSA